MVVRTSQKEHGFEFSFVISLQSIAIFTLLDGKFGLGEFWEYVNYKSFFLYLIHFYTIKQTRLQEWKVHSTN